MISSEATGRKKIAQTASSGTVPSNSASSRRAQRRSEAQLSRKCDGFQTGSDEIVSELVPDVAGRPAGDRVRYDSAGIGGVAQRRAMGIDHIGLLAAKEGGPQLHGARAQHKRRRHGAPVGNSTSRDHRHTNGIDHLGQEGEQAGLHAHVDARKRAAMAAGLGTLRDDGVDSAVFEHPGFCDRRGAGDNKDPRILDGVHDLLLGEAEMKAHHLRLRPQNHGQMLAADIARRSLGLGNRSKALRVVVGLQPAPHGVGDIGCDLRLRPKRIIHVQAAAALLPEAGDAPLGILRREPPHANAPEPASVADGGGQRRIEPVDGDEVRGHRAEDDRHVDALAVHGLQHRAGITARQILGGIAIAAGGQVAHARLLLAHAGQAQPIGSIEERGEYLAVELPALVGRALDGREARRAIAEGRLHVPHPEIVRLEHVDVAVHDPEPGLGHRSPP